MIGIDFTFVNNIEIEQERFTGSLDIFTADILDGIAKIEESDNFSIITTYAAKDFFKKRFPEYRIICIGGLLGAAINIVFDRPGINKLRKLGCLERLLKRNSIDCVWFPWMVPETTLSLKWSYVGTCHDLFCRLANDDESVSKMLSDAKMIIPISNYVKNEIIDLFGIESENITVIPNSLSIIDTSKYTKEIPKLVDKKFIFDCNSYIDRKNTLVLLKAFERIKNDIRHDLVLCGGYANQNYYNQCSSYINEHNLTNRVHMYFAIDEREKNWLFNNCDLFVNPSENEGFGRTPIEAAICLKSVISSRATALEESTCGLLHYYDNPRDDEELANTILSVLENPDSTEHLLHIRESFLNKYSLERIAGMYIDLFKSMQLIGIR